MERFLDAGSIPAWSIIRLTFLRGSFIFCVFLVLQQKRKMCYNNSNVTLELLWRKCKENYMSDMGEKKLKYIGIGEMAKLNRTTVPTLRLYDSMGLLKPCYVDEKTHYRYYDIKQNARLDMIQYMKELGMELKEIKEVLDQKDIDQIEKILQWKKVQTIQQQKELQYKMEAINRTMSNIKRYKKSPKSGTITLEYIPERIIYAMDVDMNFYDYIQDSLASLGAEFGSA